VKFVFPSFKSFQCTGDSPSNPPNGGSLDCGRFGRSPLVKPPVTFLKLSAVKRPTVAMGLPLRPTFLTFDALVELILILARASLLCHAARHHYKDDTHHTRKHILRTTTHLRSQQQTATLFLTIQKNSPKLPQTDCNFFFYQKIFTIQTIPTSKVHCKFFLFMVKKKFQLTEKPRTRHSSTDCSQQLSSQSDRQHKTGTNTTQVIHTHTTTYNHRLQLFPSIKKKFPKPHKFSAGSYNQPPYNILTRRQPNTH